MRYLLFLLTFFITTGLSAQSREIRRTLHWTPVKKQSMYGEMVEYLHFKGATYEQLQTLIPVYYEALSINRAEGIKAVLGNMVFEPLDKDKIRNVRHLQQVTGEITVDSRISIARRKPFIEISFVPLRRNPVTGAMERLVSFSINLVPAPQLKSTERRVSAHNYTAHSVLRNGSWIKVKVDEDGIYKLTYDELEEMGIGDPSSVRIFGTDGSMLPLNNNMPRQDDLEEIPLWIETGQDDQFNTGDFLLFYGHGPDRWSYDTSNESYSHQVHRFSEWNYYFITSGNGSAKSIISRDEVTGTAGYITQTYDYITHHESNDINLIKSGREWYGEHFDIYTSHDFTFDIPGLDQTEQVSARVALLARASDTTSFSVYANEAYQGRLRISGTNLSHYTSTYAYTSTGTFGFLPATDEITLTLEYHKNAASAEGWLDYITLTARRSLDMRNDQLTFRDSRSIGQGNISEYTITGASGQTVIWDVTDHHNIVHVPASLQGSRLSFKAATGVLREFVAFNMQGDFPSPSWQGDDVGRISNQDLHGTVQIDYILISHPDFIQQARQLAAFHYDQDNLDTVVVTPQKIYNEFSGGKADVAALRNFVKMFYDRSTGDHDMPRYLLLFGDGSYDNTSTDQSNTNYILTYQSENSLSPTGSYLTDDFFGLLDDSEGGSSGLMDIGIGRFPVSSVTGAEEMINKVFSYTRPDKMGDWRNIICFIGDDEDYNIHMRQADELSDSVSRNYPNFIISKIYLDAYQQFSSSTGDTYPAVNEAINQRVNKGALIINYTGHGGENGLAHEKILVINDIINWENTDKLPLFMTATCEFSRFDDYEHTSAGELVLLNPEGGGIALLTTTRLVYSSPNHRLNVEFYKYVFEKNEENEYRRLGDIIRLTKQSSGSGINKRNFTLLGDPAIVLSYPKLNIMATSVNGQPVNELTDTIKALSKVTISGRVNDDGGQLMTGFNGTLYPTVFDKETSLTTQGNDGETPFRFNIRNRILYKGKASVNEGGFSFSFIVPKDISYNFGYGKVSFYANDPQHDASGYFSQLVVGGSADSVASDSEGPGIDIYMNDDNFVYGGTTDENPELLVYVSDSNGINTIGSGIGHDITAILDDNLNNPIVLNDYYESNTDSYQSGKITYPLRNLETGPHKLKVKVWDVYNNSSEQITEFTVVSSEDLVLKHVLNYPNPFTTHTSFFFEHNHASSNLDVLIQIFTVSGKLVKSIEQEIPASGYRCGPIDWDGLDDFGSRIGRGVYIYKVKVRTESGQVAEKYEKLVILR